MLTWLFKLYNIRHNVTNCHLTAQWMSVSLKLKLSSCPVFLPSEILSLQIHVQKCCLLTHNCHKSPSAQCQHANHYHVNCCKHPKLDVWKPVIIKIEKTIKKEVIAEKQLYVSVGFGPCARIYIYCMQVCEYVCVCVCEKYLKVTMNYRLAKETN